MKNLSGALFAITVLLIISCQTNSDSESTEMTPVLPVAAVDNGGISLTDGFGAAVVVDSLEGRVRHLAVRDNGDIYVKFARSDDSLGVVALRDSDQDGVADQMERFGDFWGTGVRIHDGYLYATSDTEIFRYKLQDGQLLPETEKEIIVTGFPAQRSHEAKTIAFDNEGNMYVNIGAPSNSCQENNREKGSVGMDPCPILEEHAGIWRFSASEPGQSRESGVRYATGLRNCVAITWNDSANSLYALQHGRDQLHDMWGEIYDEKVSAVLPAEEFIQINKGDDFGWPYCYYDQIQGKKVLAPEYGGDGNEVGRCESKKDPLIGFPGHMAPNDLLFYTGNQFPEKYQNGAFIAFHGSWNRYPEPQGGYFVAFVPMENGQPSGEWEIFADGFAQLDTIVSPRDAVHRPMGLSMGPDGSLYVADSQQGKIWRIMYYGDKVARLDE